MPQRLLVPLFQRPYVWSRVVQWEPLWDDIVRQANKALASGGAPVTRHFLGAVVLQSAPPGFGGLQQWTVIDGQQRLTTLQVMCDAVNAAAASVGAGVPAEQLADVIENKQSYCVGPEDKYKVWPTNRDQEGFSEVMSAPVPVDYSSLVHKQDRLVEAHAYFYRAACAYLEEGPGKTNERAAALASAILHSLQLVVITLGTDENAQEIFETLNARMTPLTAADLIKNSIFQRLVAEGADAQALYEDCWKPFETRFWEKIVSQGRLRYPRISLFFNHWLVANTGSEVIATDVFRMFKRFLDNDQGETATNLLKKIELQAAKYREFTEAAEDPNDGSQLALFVYRVQSIDVDTIKPILLWLVDPTQEACPPEQLTKALTSLESWLMRRMLVRATTKNYNRLFADLLTRLRTDHRGAVGDVIEGFLREQALETSYWPGDDTVLSVIRDKPIYGWIRQERIRVVLEAIEDEFRGYVKNHAKKAEHRIPRGGWTIEHVMPQNYEKNWPLEGADPAERSEAIQRLGNLTLLSPRFNSSNANAGWTGPEGKRAAFKQNSVLHLNERLALNDVWDEASIEARGGDLADAIIATWPVPVGHVGKIAPKSTAASGFKLANLVHAGVVHAGQTLSGRGAAHDKHATILSDGRLEVGGVDYATPTGAAKAARNSKTNVNGWWFWLTDTDSATSIHDLYQQYLAENGSQPTD